MTVAALAALIWANSRWYSSYFTLWETPVLLHVGTRISLDLTVRQLVDDAGMALFFLLVGVELKYEALRGDLRRPGAALLPITGAIFGMVVPALIYLAFNLGHPGQRGWGIPIATDVAFAVGTIALVAARLPSGSRIFLLTLAIVDDIGGIVVITVFYTSHFNFRWLIVVAASVAAVIVLRVVDVRSVVPYAALGAAAWLALREAGIEPAVVGVIFGLLVPLEPFHPFGGFEGGARARTDRAARLLTAEDHNGEAATVALLDLADYSTLSAPVGPRIEQRLRIWVNLAVLPLFALANAGVRISGVHIDVRVFAGTLVGLVVGKAVGIFASVRTAARAARVPLPTGMTGRSLLAVSTSAGMGFSVSLFIAALAFSHPDLTASADLGVLSATAVAGVASVVLTVLLVPRRPEEPARAEP